MDDRQTEEIKVLEVVDDHTLDEEEVEGVRKLKFISSIQLL